MYLCHDFNYKIIKILIKIEFSTTNRTLQVINAFNLN